MIVTINIIKHLKYVDIPFDEDFTDLLFDTLLHLQSKPKDSLLIETKYNPTDQMLVELWSKNNCQNKETDREFIDFSRIVQNAIVSIHNCEITGSTQNLDEIYQLIQKMTEMQEHKYNSGEQNIDSRFVIILAELLYKIRCNSTFIEVRRNRLINELVVKVYKFLDNFMNNNQQIWVRLWYFSHKLFCIKWWNDKLNRYHAEFFLSCIVGLGKYKTTLYTKELFSKVWLSIEDILVKYLQKEVSRQKDDESSNEFETFINQIWEIYENKTLKENWKETKEETKDESNEERKEENEIEIKENCEEESDRESQKEMKEESSDKSDEEDDDNSKDESKEKNNKHEEIENKQRENKNKILFSIPKAEHIFRNESVVNKFFEFIIQVFNFKDWINF